MRPAGLHLLLAPKERFEAAGAGAFALNALETSRASRWREQITVFGRAVDHPFPDVRFRPLALSRWPLFGRNMAFRQAYVESVRRKPPSLVEIFNRPVMIGYLRRKLESVPLLLHLGNDPRGMDGSRSPAERRKLLANADAVVCVSDYIRRCFIDGLSAVKTGNLHIIHTGVACDGEHAAPKEKRIVYVGRIAPEKGVLELAQALAQVLPLFPDWRADIVGARWFGVSTRPAPFEREVAAVAAGCSQIALCGFRSHDGVLELLSKASISVVPSKWDDPFPRSALEALACGCALVCSRQGGLPELGEGRALFLDAVSPHFLAQALQRLMASDEERIALQTKGIWDFPFSIDRATARLDDLRDDLIFRSERLATQAPAGR